MVGPVSSTPNLSLVILYVFNKILDYFPIRAILFVKKRDGVIMYKLCKTERSATRQREMEAGLLEMMSTQRYEEISVSDLCDYLAIPRKAFYRYFTSKDGALHALIDHTLMEYEAFPALPGTRTIEKDLERFFRFWLHHRSFLDVLQRNGMSAILIARCIETTVGGTIPKRFLAQEDPETRRAIARFSVCGLMTMVLDWHHSGYLTSAAHMGKMAVRLLNQPLFPSASDLI